MTYYTAHRSDRIALQAAREAAHRRNIEAQDRRAAEFNAIKATILDRLAELAELGHAASPGFIREVAEDAARVIRAANATPHQHGAGNGEKHGG